MMDIKKTLTMENLNQHIINIAFALRGPHVIRANEIEKEIQSVLLLLFFFKKKTIFFK